MAEVKSTRHSGEQWSEDDVQQLRELAERDTSVGVLSLMLGRSEDSVRSKAQAEGIAVADEPVPVRHDELTPAVDADGRGGCSPAGDPDRAISY